MKPKFLIPALVLIAFVAGMLFTNVFFKKSENAGKAVPAASSQSPQQRTTLIEKVEIARGASATPSAVPSQASTTPASTGEIVLEVPAGAVVPAVFADDTPRSPQQQKALDRIAAEFDENVSKVAPGVSKSENWNAARKIADQRYIDLFGFQAYNKFHLQAAKEAKKER